MVLLLRNEEKRSISRHILLWKIIHLYRITGKINRSIYLGEPKPLGRKFIISNENIRHRTGILVQDIADSVKSHSL